MPRTAAKSRFETLADILEQMGGINPARIRANPPPGNATEKDLIQLNDRKDKIYELVDGVLVEKIMGFPESTLALRIAFLIQLFLEKNPLGIVAGADGATRLLPTKVRVPDVCFVSWDRLPVRGIVPPEPILDLAPDLVVEILSKGNTRGEMSGKLREYFFAGVRRVWYVEPKNRTVQDYTSPEQMTTLTEGQTLDGGEVLPGLRIPLAEIFIQMPRPSEPSSRPSKKKPGKR